MTVTQAINELIQTIGPILDEVILKLQEGGQITTADYNRLQNEIVSRVRDLATFAGIKSETES